MSWPAERLSSVLSLIRQPVTRHERVISVGPFVYTVPI
jgi:hypothetical protein